MGGVSAQELKQFFRIVVLCVCWYVVSSANGVFGKWILSEFPHPMTLTMVQLLSITIYSRPILAISGIRPINVPWSYYFQFIGPLAFAKFLSSVLAHVSIWKVPVSYAHTVKASMPLFTVLFTRFLMGECHSWKVYISLLPIMGGVAIATVSEVSFDIIGLGSALMATAGFSIMNIFSKKVLKDTGVHHLRLLHVLGQLALLMFLPVWIFTEFGALFSLFSNYEKNSSVSVIFLLVIDGILHWMQNILAFTILKLLAPLTYAVANVTKRISVISASLLLLKNPVTMTNMGGMLMAMSGVFFYSKVRYEENKAKVALPTIMKNKNNVKGLSHPLWKATGDFSQVKLLPNDYLKRNNNGYIRMQ